MEQTGAAFIMLAVVTVAFIIPSYLLVMIILSYEIIGRTDAMSVVTVRAIALEITVAIFDSKL